MIELPPGACDAHCHVFGPQARFPFAPERTFTPDDVPKERLYELHEQLGFERAVIVQSACHGRDHAALLDALAHGAGTRRGVALIAPATTRTEIERLHAAGIRGFRVSFLPHLGPPPARADIDAMIALTKPFGWHLELHVAGDGVLRLADLVRSLEVRVVIDHLARVELDDARALDALLSVLAERHVWIKLSGADRVSRRPDYADGAALARLLFESAPARAVWGTDFPHPNVEGDPPDDRQLVDLIATIAPTEDERRRLLVDNPMALFGF